MKYILQLSCLYTCSCNLNLLKQDYTGSAVGRIAGNVYWRYHKSFSTYPPDAGCNVFLFKHDATNIFIHAKCDDNGNFFLDTLQDGPYRAIIISKHVTCNSVYFFNSIDNSLCQEFLGLQLRKLNQAEYDSVKYFDSIYNVYAENKIKQPVTSLGYNDFKRNEVIADSLRNDEALKVLELIPKTTKLLPLIIYTAHLFKIHVAEISVSNGRSQPLVLNFSEGDYM